MQTCSENGCQNKNFLKRIRATGKRSDRHTDDIGWTLSLCQLLKTACNVLSHVHITLSSFRDRTNPRIHVKRSEDNCVNAEFLTAQPPHGFNFCNHSGFLRRIRISVLVQTNLSLTFWVCQTLHENKLLWRLITSITGQNHLHHFISPCSTRHLHTLIRCLKDSW